MKDPLKEIQDIAKSKGGKCLSAEYVNIDSHMEFECHVGHRWSTTPYYIKKGSWCSECFYKERAGDTQRLSSTAMHEIAIKKGWKCLSTEYRNARIKLRWECENGHIFERSLSHVKEGRGCPDCEKK